MECVTEVHSAEVTAAVAAEVHSAEATVVAAEAVSAEATVAVEVAVEAVVTVMEDVVNTLTSAFIIRCTSDIVQCA